MPIQTIEFQGKDYPLFQAQGNAAQFCRPFAEILCTGVGYDIGYGKEEWKLPSSIGVDLADNTEYNAMNLPRMAVDFIHASHLLEHLNDWVGALDYWGTVIRTGGVLFLYLPHPSQEYWLPFNNRKHIHCLYPEIIKKYLDTSPLWRLPFVSEYDLNNSFYAVAEKI